MTLLIEILYNVNNISIFRGRIMEMRAKIDNQLNTYIDTVFADVPKTANMVALINRVKTKAKNKYYT